MKITIAMDSFKGSLSSIEAGKAVETGIRCVYPQADVNVCPLADGGEGTTYALTTGMGGDLIGMKATGPLGNPVSCSYGIIWDSRTAIIEMSAAAGITLVPEAERNPMNTTTYGVGEMIVDAIGRGCRKFIVGIGGSATNDGGIGMLQALGYGLLTNEGKQVPFGAKGLSVLKQITDDKVIPHLAECSFKIACDVTNTLCGEQGCSTVYDPQKGADSAMIMQMDRWLTDYAALAKEKYPKANLKQAGTGAAGGLGFAFLTFTNAVLEPGIKIVLDEICLSKYIMDSDLVITGEGRLDGQTVMGKAPIGVARLAKEYGKPVIAFCGCATKDAVLCNEAGIDAFFPILREVVTPDEALNAENAAANMSDTVEQAFRLIRALSSDSNDFGKYLQTRS